MVIIIFVVALICALLAYLLIEEDKKNTAILAGISLQRGREDAQNGAEAFLKPFTIESIRTALRFNGFSPEVPESNDRKDVTFMVDGLRFHVVTGFLPAVSIELGFNYGEPENDALLRRAADDLSTHMYVIKTVVLGEGEFVVFSAEFLCDSYTYFRDNLKEYIDGLLRARDRFREAYGALLERQKQEKEAVFSGNSFIQDPSTHPIIQS